MAQMQDLENLAKESGLYPLRPAQVRAFEGLISGRNLLLVWPTGSGKSLCYQLPSQTLPGLTVVVSPLIALMDDQVAKARALAWSATCIHSGLKREERERRLKKVAAGGYKLLYVTPERFRQEEFCQVLAAQKVALLAVDEAHCISQWGHDFRPDYTRLREIRRRLGDPQVIALTATATHEVQDDILRQLGLSTQDTTLLWEGVERPNLHLSAVECEDVDAKLIELEAWLKEIQGPKIVYFTLISSLEKTAEALARRGFVFDVYHGDLNDGVRKRNQEKFLQGEAQLLLATPAFGLGIDKPDVRGVLHFEAPAALESYFQEVGRAGRDQAPSHCRLLYCQQDLDTQMRFIENLTPDPSYVRALYDLLVSWRDRLPTLTLEDLREQLSFKNKRDFRLETALNLLDRWEVISWPRRQLKELEILRSPDPEELSVETWKARKLQLQKKLAALVLWFRSEDCRKLGIYRYFGWPQDQRCGFCDRCEGDL